jgi:DNA repair protein RecN (Recombination protein N)
VVAFAAAARRRVAELKGYEQAAAAFEQRRHDADRRAVDAAARLSAARHAAAGPLGEAVTRHLRELALPDAALTVVLEAAPLTEDGADAVTFLLAPNPGEPPKPLARAASGGELSRAMLALRLVLTEGPPSLVFDEVDAGIAGEAGTAVGRLLADLARRHQVLCVTHLAQVAAYAETQVAVVKREEGGRTVARATVVDGETRLGELSRMLAGLGESAHARRHATELLERAAGARPVAS